MDSDRIGFKKRWLWGKFMPLEIFPDGLKSSVLVNENNTI